MNEQINVRDLLHNLDDESGATDEYCRGILVAVVSTIMAYENCSFESAWDEVLKDIPENNRSEAIPKTWLKGE